MSQILDICLQNPGSNWVEPDVLINLNDKVEYSPIEDFALMHLGCIFEGISRADTLQHQLVCKIQERGVSNLGYYKWKRKQSLPHSRIKSLLNAHSQFPNFSVFQFFLFSFWSDLAHSWKPQLYFGSYANQLFLCYDVCATQRYILHIWDQELNMDKLWRTTALIYFCLLLGDRSWLATNKSFSHVSASISVCCLVFDHGYRQTNHFCTYLDLCFQTVSRNTSTEKILTNCV